MPMELVDIIFDYLVEFHRFDATERLHAMRETYRVPWSLVMSDVRAGWGAAPPPTPPGAGWGAGKVLTLTQSEQVRE